MHGMLAMPGVAAHRGTGSQGEGGLWPWWRKYGQIHT